MTTTSSVIVIIIIIIIHQTHYGKSDWSRAFNQFTIACELDMRNVVSAEDITFIMSSSTSAWLLSPLESSQQMNAFSCLLFKNCIIKQLLDSVFAWYHELSNPRVCVICLPYLTTIKARSEKPNQAKASSSRSNAMFRSCSLVIPTLKCLSYSFPKTVRDLFQDLLRTWAFFLSFVLIWPESFWRFLHNLMFSHFELAPAPTTLMKEGVLWRALARFGALLFI